MQNLAAIVAPVIGLTIGMSIGVGFGLFQQFAKRHNEQQQTQGNFKSAWRIMPGSGARVAFLLLTLALIQIICPALFTNGTQWWVSGGVVTGYGLMLYKQLRVRMAQSL